MAPIAAGLTVSLNDTGTTIELNVLGSTGRTGIAMVIEAPGVLSNFVKGPEALLFIYFEDIVTINGDSGEYWLCPFPPSDDGVWFIADWSAPVPVRVSAYEHMSGGWFLLDQIQVPEPTTIALLTLTSLFLLRRRR